MKIGEPVKTKLAQLNFPPVKFKAFPLLLGNNVDARVVELSENDDKKINLTQIFGKAVRLDNHNKKVMISDEAHSEALEYLFRKLQLRSFDFMIRKPSTRLVS